MTGVPMRVSRRLPTEPRKTVRVREHESAKLANHFTGYQVKQITRKMYQDFLIDLHEKGFAANTISGIHSTGKMIFAKAVELEVIKNDPTEFAKPPRAQRTVDDIENQEQSFKYLEKDELTLFLVRIEWADLNTDDYTIEITKTYYNPRNVTMEYQLLTPKTSKSIRTIEPDPMVFKELSNHKDKQNEIKRLNKDDYHDKDFIFAKIENYKEYPELIKTIHNRMRRLLRLAGLNEKLSPHSLRHTHVSLLAEAGADIFQIIERLGHSSDEQIRTVYLHVTKTMKKEASQKFSELMRNL
jgi:integrase